MRVLLLAILLTGVFAITPEQCDRADGDEVEYYCEISNGSVSLTAKKNDYVKIDCAGSNIKCDDLPKFDLAAGLPLKSLGVSSCPPSVLTCVNEHILTPSVEIVTLTNLTGPLTTEQLQKLGDVRVLMLQQAGAETSSPSAIISSYPNLRRLTINGGHFQLSPNLFEAAPPLKYLELSKDHIASIPPDSFKGLSSLIELNVWGNPVQEINAGAFRGLDSLERLTLTSNNLSRITAGAFSDVPNLRSLYMMANRIESLSNGLLPGLEHLENITIQMNYAELTLDTEAFSRLPSLKNVLVKYSKMRHLPSGLFNNSNSVASIQMNNAYIETLGADIFLRLAELRRLDLSYNRIEVLPEGLFRGLKSLEYLNLNRNFIETLGAGLFDGVSHLRELHMDFNKISNIAMSAFNGAYKLHTLSLSSNQLTLEPDDSVKQKYRIFSDTWISPFNGLVWLVKLNLGHNQIRTMFDDWQTTLLHLEYLDLSYNQFRILEFDHNAINFIASKLTVDLRYNRIPSIILDKYTTPIAGNGSHATILLDNNPIACDCSMYGLRIRLNGTKYADNEPTFVLDNARCSTPPDLQGELFTQLPPERLICDITEDLPESCTSCVANVATNELVFNCSRLPILPDTKSPNISYYFVKEPTITLNLKHQPVSLGHQRIHTLNLSNAGISHIEFSPSKYLQVLDLTNNKLNSVPTSFLKGNITLYLSNNPFECECWYADDISALQKYGFVADLAQISCANGEKLALIDATALCNTWKASIAAVGTFVVLGACVLIAAMIVYRYSNEILIYMTTRGICRCCIKEVLLDKDKEYDVFISFAHQDLGLVQDHLLPMLENDFNQKVCVHYRDWVVGDMIPTQILRSVETSRRTVIVLSKNFLESIWANLEFCAAHNLALQEGKARVILILLEENLVRHEKLSEELRAYIATNTYLLWDDPKFSEKLRKVLPRKQHRFTLLDALKQRPSGGEKEGIVGLDVQLNSEGQLVNVAKKVMNESVTLPHHFV